RIHDDDKERVLSEFNKAVRDKKVTYFQNQYRVRGQGGTYYHILDKLKFIRNKSGKLASLVSVWKDISDVVQKQSKLDSTHSAMEIDRSRFKLISEMSNAAMRELNFATQKMNWFAGSNALEEF